jgi:DNA-binding NtrC family response regulator
MSATRFSPSSEAPPTTLKGRLTELVDELVRQGVTLEQARKEFERQFISASIRDHEGSLCRSARSLGVHRNTLRNKLNDLGIQPGGGRNARRGPRTLPKR